MTEEIKTVSFDDLKDTDYVLVDLETVPGHMRDDYNTRNENIKAGKPLCDRCAGTGNKMFSMFRRCQECGGSGQAKEGAAT